MRRRILDAATELIARDGISGLRYDELAALAQVNKTTVYRNWPDRGALVADALVGFGADVAPLRDTGDLHADLVEFVDAFAAASVAPQGRALLATVAAARENPELRAVVDGVSERRLAVLDGRLRVATERGELPPVEASLLADLLTGAVQAFLARGRRSFVRADAERVVAVVLAGVRATSQA